MVVVNCNEKKPADHHKTSVRHILRTKPRIEYLTCEP